MRLPGNDIEKNVLIISTVIKKTGILETEKNMLANYYR